VKIPLTATLGQPATQSSVAPTIVPLSTTSTASASQIIPSTASELTPSSAVNIPTTTNVNNSGGLSTGSKIAAIVGPVCSVLGLMWAVGFGLWRHKNKQKKQRETEMLDRPLSSPEMLIT